MYFLFQNRRVRAQLQSHQSKTKPTSVKHSELDIWALFVVLWAPGVLGGFASFPLLSPEHGSCLVGSGCLQATPAAVRGCPTVLGSLICWGLLLQPRWAPSTTGLPWPLTGPSCFPWSSQVFKISTTWEVLTHDQGQLPAQGTSLVPGTNACHRVYSTVIKHHEERKFGEGRICFSS